MNKRIEIVPRSSHEGQGLCRLPFILNIEPQPVLIVRLVIIELPDRVL